METTCLTSKQVPADNANVMPQRARPYHVLDKPPAIAKNPGIP